MGSGLDVGRWMDGCMDGWEEKSVSDRESLFNAAADPGRELLAIPTIFFSSSSGGFHLNCVVLDVLPCTTVVSQGSEKRAETGKLNKSML